MECKKKLFAFSLHFLIKLYPNFSFDVSHFGGVGQLEVLYYQLRALRSSN